MATVKMFAPAGAGGLIQTENSGNVSVAADGTVIINALDVPTFVKLGFEFAVSRHAAYTTPTAPAAASAAATVSSVALSNGTLTIAAQPDVPRQLAAVVFPGTTSITAGVLTLTYTANDGTTQSDALSLAMANQTAGTAGGTLNTSKGVEHLTSAIVTGLVGGTTPGIEIGTNAVIGLPLDPRFVDLVVTKETKVAVTQTTGASAGTDETVGAVNTSGGLITTTSAPNGLLYFNLLYNYTMPG